MPRSRNPHDYGVYITDILDFLLTNTPPRYTFECISKADALRLRREFYAYKGALNFYIAKAKRDDPELEFFTRYRRAFSMYSMKITAVNDKHYLIFEHRDETDLASIAYAAMATAKVDNTSIHGLTEEDKERILREHREKVASGAIAGRTAGDPTKGKFQYDPSQAPRPSGLAGREQLTTGSAPEGCPDPGTTPKQ